MTEKVLLVDDEPNVLQAYRRSLRKLRGRFTLDVCESPALALGLVDKGTPYAVIVSDMRMPGMNGVELLAEVKKRAPDTVRMMLTGNSDQGTAVQAVNQGDVYRFLTKPCSPEDLARTIFAGLDQYKLITAEKELLEKTLQGSIEVLTDLLSLVNPEAFGRTTRVRRLVVAVAAEMELRDAWRLHTAALLSQIGCVILPPEVVKKVYHGEALDGEESQLYEQHPCLGADLLAKIPRMEEIARSVLYQGKNFDGTGVPHDEVRGEDIPLGARLLRSVLEYERLDAGNRSPAECMRKLADNASWYDSRVLAALGRVVLGAEAPQVRTHNLADLAEGMVLAESIYTKNGVLVVAKGQDVTRPMREWLVNLWRGGVIPGRIPIVMPRDGELTGRVVELV